MKNQCDGCCTGQKLIEGNLHVNEWGNPTMVCQKKRYETKRLFEKEYHGEELVDIENDIFFFLDGSSDIPVDDHEMYTGKFKVTIEWTPEED